MNDLLDPIGRCMAALLDGQHGIGWALAFVICVVVILMAAVAAILAAIGGALL